MGTEAGRGTDQGTAGHGKGREDGRGRKGRGRQGKSRAEKENGREGTSIVEEGEQIVKHTVFISSGS